MENIDSYVDNRDFEVQGISGNVSKFTNEAVSYPYFLLENTKECPVEFSKLKVLANIIATSKITESSLSPVSIYYKDNDKVLKLGKLSAKQVKSFLRLFDGNLVSGMYDKNTKLEGEHLYVLAE